MDVVVVVVVDGNVTIVLIKPFVSSVSGISFKNEFIFPIIRYNTIEILVGLRSIVYVVEESHWYTPIGFGIGHNCGVMIQP